MMKALPDCNHRLHVCRGGMDQWAPAELEGVATWSTGKLERGKYDFILCHNTQEDQVPKGMGPVVYYAHSANSTTRRPPRHIATRLCVSNWLADKIGWDRETVLYQPTATPSVNPDAPNFGVEGQIVVGRICTPIDRKWEWDDWLPYYEAVAASFPLARFEFVGMPRKQRLGTEVLLGDLRCVFTDAAVWCRSLLHEWDILLYTSSVEESFGRVVREAQRCGCFPIVSDRGGFVEQIAVTPATEWGPGHLIRDPSEVVEIVRKWLPEKDRLSDLCREWGDRTGSLQAWREGFLKVLSKL